MKIIMSCDLYIVFLQFYIAPSLISDDKTLSSATGKKGERLLYPFAED
jgi:hypothetical protein